ncbi:hypothetical protein SODALDRAFT_361556 [Sodiomyces alkalinus F11]|uniref:Uncharacterized protein n=1 Tax=Sodiomyces alkalinus (strain CBS 110278 / VKM F-3762 / F11) TaxID=1314773 RepID=A0A3N2PQF2_SODAK|nr:hypothetical protein SODALDRAFT_361556 [Sodiomyces alkalinus F11]ROT36737.1 hypothetical protein SODALDRAFT_361556 [Sodiomyces alkalinus F11]
MSKPAHTRFQRTLSSTMPREATRPFSTQARVHPTFLPYLHTRGRLAARWVPSTIAFIAAAYAVNHYIQLEAASRRAAENDERQARESRALTIELLDAYGDGSSLEALEKAVEVYEARTAASGSGRSSSG